MDSNDQVLPPLSDESDSDTDTVTDSTDPRHQKRVILMQAVFATSFHPNQETASDDPEVAEQVTKILAEALEIDQAIQELAPERPISDINKVDLAILRLIVFESRHKKTPTKVLLDEAVELAKEFGTESSPKFVNGVLGQLLLP